MTMMFRPVALRLSIAIALLCMATLASAQKTVVLNVGDSITEGARVGDYSTILQELLGDDYEIVNAGRSGATYTRTDPRDYRRMDVYEKAIATPANIVTIMLGTNDSKVNASNPDQNIWPKAAPTFAEDVRDQVRTFESLPTSPTVWLVLPPPATDDNAFSIKGSVIAGEIIPILLRVAAEERIGTIDLWHSELATLSDDGLTTEGGVVRAEHFLDGVHPSASGNRVIAGKMARVIGDATQMRLVDLGGNVHLLMPPRVEERLAHTARVTWYRAGQADPVAAGVGIWGLRDDAPHSLSVLVAPDPATYDRIWFERPQRTQHVTLEELEAGE